MTFLLGCLFPIRPLVAGDLLALGVTDEDGVYRIDVEMIVHAPAEEVWYVLTDYTHIYRLNASITESEVLPSPDENTVRVRTLVNDCVFVYCFDIERVEDVHMTGTGKLHAIAVSDLSNIESGTATWHIRPAGADSRVSYRGTIKPGFVVLPVIGNYIVRNRLRDMTLLTLENIERISRIKAGLDANTESALVISTTP
jgi:hypothetical protein